MTQAALERRHRRAKARLLSLEQPPGHGQEPVPQHDLGQQPPSLPAWLCPRTSWTCLLWRGSQGSVNPMWLSPVLLSPRQAATTRPPHGSAAKELTRRRGEGGPSENRASALGKWPGVHREPAVSEGRPTQHTAPEPVAAVQSVIPGHQCSVSDNSKERAKSFGCPMVFQPNVMTRPECGHTPGALLQSTRETPGRVAGSPAGHPAKPRG